MGVGTCPAGRTQGLSFPPDSLCTGGLERQSPDFSSWCDEQSRILTPEQPAVRTSSVSHGLAVRTAKAEGGQSLDSLEKTEYATKHGISCKNSTSNGMPGPPSRPRQQLSHTYRSPGYLDYSLCYLEQTGAPPFTVGLHSGKPIGS